MHVSEFCDYYPHVFHIAEDGSWPSIMKRGLLCSATLLREFGASEVLFEKTLHRIRTEMIEIIAPDGTSAWIRDQRPLTQGRLQKCLIDMSVPEWLELLNSHVFFWVRKERLLTHLGARGNRARTHTVLVLRSDVLLQRFARQARVTPMNTGSTMRLARPRGRATFST